jgi:large subunit ribosomal protein L13
MKTIFVKPNDIEQKWRLIDANGQVLGRLAVKVVNILRGKDKP